MPTIANVFNGGIAASKRAPLKTLAIIVDTFQTPQFEDF